MLTLEKWFKFYHNALCERNAHLVGSLLGQLELELWVAEEAGQTRVGGARTTALLVPASLHRRRRMR